MSSNKFLLKVGDDGPEFTDNRKRAYTIEYAGNAGLICKLLERCYPGTEFTVLPEMEGENTAMHIIGCSARALKVSKIKKLLFFWR